MPTSKSRYAFFIHRRDVRHDAGAFRLRHRERNKLAGDCVRRQGGRDVEHRRDPSGQKIAHALVGPALVVHRQDLGACASVEQLRGEMARRTGTGRAECERVPVLPSRQRSVPSPICGNGRMHHQHIRVHAKECNWFEVRSEIKGRASLHGVERVGDGRHEQRVAVLGCARDSLRPPTCCCCRDDSPPAPAVRSSSRNAWRPAVPGCRRSIPGRNRR